MFLGASTRHTPLPTDPQASLEVVAQFHTAEYQAITNKIAYWMALQYSIAGLILAVALDLVKEPGRLVESGLRIWAVVFIFEFLGGAYYYVLSEIMYSSDYIENNLAPTIRKLFPDVTEFWGYERYKRFNRVYRPSGMYLSLIFCIAIPYAALLVRPFPHEFVDYACAILSACLVFCVFLIAKKAVAVQRRFAP